MRQRVRFRALLPTINLFLFGVLSVWGAPNRVVAMIQAEGTLQVFNPWNNPLSPLLSGPRLFTVALNAPAFGAASLIVVMLRVPYLATANSVLLIMVPFIAVFWWLLGRWLDRRLGLLPALPATRRALLIPAVVLTTITLTIFTYRSIFFLAGGKAGFHGETPLVAASSYGMTAWLTIWLIMLVTAIKRHQNAISPAQNGL